MLPALAVFGLTYVLISARRLSLLPLDRPSGALLGAVLTVAVGLLTPRQAIDAVDGETLLLLFGMMGMGAFLAKDAFFERAAVALAVKARTRRRLLRALVFGCGAFAALVTNDAVCVLGAPLVVGLIQRFKLPPLPFLLALATSANTGSVATLVGNPQNMLCAQLGGLSYRAHLLAVAPLAVLCLLLNDWLIGRVFARALHEPLAVTPDATPVLTPSSQKTLIVIALSVVAYTAGLDLAWTAAGGCTALLILQRPEPGSLWRHIDWSILLLFAGLFVVVEGFSQSGAPAAFFARLPLFTGSGPLDWLRTAGLYLVGSNVVSNVPFILLVRAQLEQAPDPWLAWELLAVVSTFAGNLTLIGSVANIIVAEGGRPVGGMGFVEYLKVGAPLALLTCALGTFWLMGVATWAHP